MGKEPLRITARLPNPLPPTRHHPIDVAIINASTIVSDDDVERVRHALNFQLDQHFSPLWGLNCSLRFVARGHKVPKNHWWLVIADDSDEAGALGYHDTTDEFLPIGKVFVRTSQRYGEAWSETASHELLELLADPWIYLTAGPQASTGYLYAYEVCDACQDQGYDIEVGGVPVRVSDFVTPAWFGDGPAYDGRYNFLNTIKQPFELLPGGYISVLTRNGWTNLWGKTGKKNAEAVMLRARKPVGSRSERRRIGEDMWVASEKPSFPEAA